MLPSVIDDIDMGVTHVVRGEDHVSNTALQLQMFAALGAAPPAFAHEALLTGSEGKLSKRLGSLGVDAFPRGRASSRRRCVALLARIGTSDPVEPVADRRAADRELRLRALRPRAGAVRRGRTGGAQRADRPPAAVLTRSPTGCPAGMDARGWEAIRPNLATVAEAADWWRGDRGAGRRRTCAAEDRDFLAAGRAIAGGRSTGRPIPGTR